MPRFQPPKKGPKKVTDIEPVEWVVPDSLFDKAHKPRGQFRPAWANKFTADGEPDNWLHPNDWEQLEVACPTEGCENQGIRMLIPYIGQPVLCGPCGARLDHPELGDE